MLICDEMCLASPHSYFIRGFNSVERKRTHARDTEIDRSTARLSHVKPHSAHPMFHGVTEEASASRHGGVTRCRKYEGWTFFWGEIRAFIVPPLTCYVEPIRRNDIIVYA